MKSKFDITHVSRRYNHVMSIWLASVQLHKFYIQLKA